jgi:hypothetical protein
MEVKNTLKQYVSETGNVINYIRIRLSDRKEASVEEIELPILLTKDNSIVIVGDFKPFKILTRDKKNTFDALVNSSHVWSHDWKYSGNELIGTIYSTFPMVKAKKMLVKSINKFLQKRAIVNSSFSEALRSIS